MKTRGRKAHFSEKAGKEAKQPYYARLVTNKLGLLIENGVLVSYKLAKAI